MWPYLYSYGPFAYYQRYYNSTADDLMTQGMRELDGPARQAIYDELQDIYYQDVPSVALYVPIARGYSRDWVCGHYYNPLYPGIYAYGHWKWNYLKGDINYDGRTDFGDITTILKAFASYANKAGSATVSFRWNFHCDIADSPHGWRDRKVDLKDILTALQKFGDEKGQWQPLP
jgi:hypothetical protein